MTGQRRKALFCPPGGRNGVTSRGNYELTIQCIATFRLNKLAYFHSSIDQLSAKPLQNYQNISPTHKM